MTTAISYFRTRGSGWVVAVAVAVGGLKDVSPQYSEQTVETFKAYGEASLIH